jgi:hypothetical protein
MTKTVIMVGTTPNEMTMNTAQLVAEALPDGNFLLLKNRIGPIYDEDKQPIELNGNDLLEILKEFI